MSAAEIQVQQLRSQLPRVRIGGTEYLVAEGDLLVSASELAEYAERRFTPGPPLSTVSVEAHGRTAQLVGIGEDGKLVRWAPGVVLTYYVRKESFTAAQYPDVRASFVQATEDWMATCGVAFQHLADLDDHPEQRAAAAPFFIVEFVDAGGRFIAAAFFPNQPPARRRVYIDPSYFNPNPVFDQAGVLRHELGHVLGFRHEHIRSGAPPSCPQESLVDTIDLTQYDPQSVMHYFCGDVGSRTLAITDIDRVGAQRLYGLPLSDFTLVRP